MNTQDVKALEVADESFLVASLIDRCPKTMMIRELLMNALEAAKLAPVGKRDVVFSSVPMDGTEKLCIWNAGRGMDATELMQICNIASSLGKEMSLTGNFGMGAKVASLPSNQRGMRYRSCKDGNVHEVILCKRDGVYGLLRRRMSGSQEYVEVADVTDIVQTEGRNVDTDWTEVLLLGNQPDQNTVKDPYNGDPTQETQWLATYLYHRFYRLPDGVKVTLLKGTHKLDGTRQFQTIPNRSSFFERNETVDLQNGFKIHYFYDAPYEKATAHNRSISGAVASAVSTAAIIYKDEMYDLKRGRNWTFEAPIYGIPFGAKYISVHIELSASANVVPEGYRRFLQYTNGEQTEVTCHDFADIVRENRPQWLIEIIKSLAPDSETNDDIRDELQKLLNELRVKRFSPKTVQQGALDVASGTGAGATSTSESSNGNSAGTNASKATDLSIVPSGAKKAELFKNVERAPEIILLHEDSEVEEKGFKGRAARFVMEASQLFINMNYPAIGDMASQLESEYADASDIELLRGFARQHSQRTMITRVGRTVVYALAKQLNKEWDQRALEIASAPESLSMAADDFQDAMQSVRRAISKALGTSRNVVELAEA